MAVRPQTRLGSLSHGPLLADSGESVVLECRRGDVDAGLGEGVRTNLDVAAANVSPRGFINFHLLASSHQTHMVILTPKTTNAMSTEERRLASKLEERGRGVWDKRKDWRSAAA